jgi:cytochrome P450 family 135
MASSQAPYRFPPGPALPAPVQTALWLTRPVSFPAWCVRRYGPTYTLRLAMTPHLVLLSEPQHLAQLMGLSADVATAGEENLVLEPLLGHRSVLMLDGPEHVHLRRLLAPFFRGEAMRRHEAEVAEIVAHEVGLWPRGRPFQLLPRMRAITLEVILQVVFGLRSSPRRQQIRGALEDLLNSGRTWMVFGWARRDLGPRSPWGRFLRFRAEVDRLLEEEIAERRQGPLEHDTSLLGELLRAGGEGGSPTRKDPLDPGTLRDQLLTMLVAGLETTATELSWCFLLLLHHPNALEAVRHDQRWREAAVRETLRLRPAFRLVSRRLHEPLELGDYRLPPGATIAGSILDTHARAAAYPYPDTFAPARFLDRPPDAHGWIPFGGGLRRCLGVSFAPFEMDVVLRETLARVDLRAAEDHLEPVSLHAVVMVPKHGARAVVTSVRAH